MANKINISVDADAAFYDATDALTNGDIQNGLRSLFVVAHDTGLLDWSDTEHNEDGSFWMGVKMLPGSDADRLITAHKAAKVYG